MHLKHNKFSSLSCLFVWCFVFILPFVIVVSQLIFDNEIAINFARKELLGIDYNYTLKELLYQTISHRSQSIERFIAASPIQKLPSNQSQIEEIIKNIDKVDERLGKILQTSADWRIIKERWQSLKEQLLTSSVGESLDYHNLLIADILSLMAHVGDTSNLILDPEIDSYYLMDTLIRNLPNLIENTARLRELGANIVRRGNFTLDEKAEAIVLSKPIESSLTKISRGMQIALNKNSTLKIKLENYIAACLQNNKIFVETFAQKVISLAGIDITPAEYLTASSKALESQFELYDAGSVTLKNLLQNRIDRLSRKKYFIQAFALLVIAISIYVIVAFARNLNKRQRAEKALQKAETKYRQIFENAVAGIFQTTPDGRYLSANQALARIYGYASPEELINTLTNIEQQLYVDRKRRARFITTIQKNGAVTNFVSQVYRKDGSTIWIAENARAVRDADGKLLYYEGTVEDITKRRVMEEALSYQQEQTERLLLNILPGPIAARLKLEEKTIADSFSEVTVLFADLVEFTQLSEKISPIELVELLNEIFSVFDGLAEEHGLEKIKTIGDAYMVVGGIPMPRTDHAEAVAKMALDMQKAIADFNAEKKQSFRIRIGINTGPVVAGVIGVKKFIYDLWGDAVNTASRMESQGIPGAIQVSATTWELLKDKFTFKERGVIDVKGKGEMTTYLLLDRKEVGARG